MKSDSAFTAKHVSREFFFKTESLRSIAWVVAVLLCAAPGRATTWFVTNAADSGPGTLRGYVSSASSGDTITFSDIMYGQTIHLTSGRLLVTQSSLIIDDTGGLLTIDGGGKSPLLEMTNHTPLCAFDHADQRL